NEKKPPVELLADRLMNYYGFVVFIVAIAASVTWLLVFQNPYSAAVVLITTIIMGYPCALGITTPLLAAIAGGKGLSIGLLVKASEVFYSLSKVDTIVFDKTGTLTYGKPTVTDVLPLGISEERLLRIAGTVEEKSEHPLAQSIAFYAKKNGVLPVDVDNFKAIAGKGASATINKKSIVVGSPRFLIECGVSIEGTTLEKMNTLGRDGKTVIGIAEENTLIGLIALQDTPRDQTIQVMDRIKAKGLRTVMLTGDARAVAEAIASQIGIKEVKSELLPDDKVHEIKQLQRTGFKVAFVGDGINDAPALAQADVGIAIGAGTDIAIESAGVILIGNRTIDALNAVILGKASYRTLTGNVIIAVIFNIIGMLLAAVGLISPLMAIGIMIVSIFTILLNTLRVRSIKLESITDTNKKQTFTQCEFKIPNMVCEGCVRKITDEIKKLPGIMSINPRVIRKQIIVNYNGDKITQTEIKAAITNAGYDPLEI
ncbi:MAG: heavy metal translocating P-type ATPase, partial [Chitinophagaceae bacterium]|nr:heavy metal translocating P-type ATPase [Chitinophagaceae bacterium]